MGSDIMKSIMSDWITGLRNDSIDDFTNLLDYNVVFNCENTLKEQLGINVNPILTTVFSYAFYLLVLKFVWKCFDTYLLGLDGDEDADPMILLFNFIKALIISLGFGLLFSSLLNAASDIVGALLASLKLKKITIDGALDVLINLELSLFLYLCLGIYTILAVILLIQFVTKAIELEILRIGISFASVGLLDSDGGVFKPYAKKFFQICWTIILQSICFKLSMIALANASIIWALSFVVMALKAPAFLQEFIMVNQGGGGKIQQALYSMSILRSFGKA